MKLKRRGFFSALLAGAVAPLVAAKPAETPREVNYHPEVIQPPIQSQWPLDRSNIDFLIKAAFVRVGVTAEGESLSASELQHWRRHIHLCNDFDDLTAQVASSHGFAWPAPVYPRYDYYFYSGDPLQVWPRQYTVTTSTTSGM